MAKWFAWPLLKKWLMNHCMVGPGVNILETCQRTMPTPAQQEKQNVIRHDSKNETAPTRHTRPLWPVRPWYSLLI